MFLTIQGFTERWELFPSLRDCCSVLRIKLSSNFRMRMLWSRGWTSLTPVKLLRAYMRFFGWTRVGWRRVRPRWIKISTVKKILSFCIFRGLARLLKLRRVRQSQTSFQICLAKQWNHWSLYSPKTIETHKLSSFGSKEQLILKADWSNWSLCWLLSSLFRRPVTDSVNTWRDLKRISLGLNSSLKSFRPSVLTSTQFRIDSRPIFLFRSFKMRLNWQKMSFYVRRKLRLWLNSRQSHQKTKIVTLCRWRGKCRDFVKQLISLFRSS